MKIVNKREVHSLPLSLSSVTELYSSEDICVTNSIAHNLQEVISAIKDNIDVFQSKFTCLIDERALNAFIAFANDVYQTTRNEACGILAGYYFHNPNDEEKKIILATNFIEAHGPATRVTCEISFDDNIRIGDFCDENKMFPLIWVHSHPGFGTFYSGTDSDTLARSFRAKHQMGIVIDNLQNQVMGFKIKDGKEKNESVYTFNLTESQQSGELRYRCLYEAVDKSDSNLKVISMKKNEPEVVKQVEEVTKEKDSTAQPNVEKKRKHKRNRKK